MIKRILKWLFGLLVALIILMLFFTMTESGLKITSTLAQQFIPGKLKINSVQGRIIRQFVITGFSYQHKKTILTIQKIDFKWNSLALLIGRFDIDKLYVNKFTLETPKIQQQKSIKSGFSWSNLMPPIQITAGNIELKHITFQQGNSLSYISDIKLDAKTTSDTLKINTFSIHFKPYFIQANGSLQLKLPYQSNLTTQFIGHFQGIKPIHASLTIQGNLNHNLTVNGKISKPATGNIHLKLINALQQGPVDLNAQWNNLLIPIGDTTSLSTQSGKIKINGTLKNYQLYFDGTLGAISLPTGHWILKGNGDLKQINLTSIQSKLLNGTLSGHLKFVWSPWLQWRGEIKGNQINPGLQWSDWEGKINFHLKSHGEIQPKKPSIYVLLDTLNGRLHNHPLSGHIEYNQNENGITIPKTYLHLGNDIIKINGNLLSTWNLKWTAKLPNITEMLPSITGAANGSGSITGNKQFPNIQTRFNLLNIYAKNIYLNKLNIDSHLNFRKNGALNTNLSLNKLYYNNYNIKKLTLNINGTTHRHIIKANLHLKHATFFLQAMGNFFNHCWNGTIQKINLSSKIYKNWRLEQPFKTALSANKIVIQPFQWMTNDANLSGEFSWLNNQSLMLNLQGKNIPSTFLNLFLLNHGKINTAINLNAHVKNTPNKKTLGQINIQSNAGNFSLNENNKIKSFDFSKFALNISAKNDGLHGSLILNKNRKKLINLSLLLPGYYSNEPMLPTQNITGSLKINLDSLNILPIFIPNISEIDGNLAANISVNNMIAQPDFTGHFTLQNGRVKINPLNITLSNIYFKLANHSDNLFSIDAKATSNKGNLKIDGTTGLLNTSVHSNIAITGDNFQIANNDEHKLSISPNLKLAYEKPNLNITGDVKIPYAKITPKDFTAVVSLPSNIKVINSNTEHQKAIPIHLHTSINAILSKDVSIALNGLNAQLNGSIKINATPNELTTGTGTLKIIKGNYTFGDTKLALDYGSIIYLGGPIDDPGLDIRVSKKIRQLREAQNLSNITAAKPQAQAIHPTEVGLYITGTAKNPKVTLFSVPSGLRDADILSYIVLGTPSNQASGASGQLLLQAANSMGLKGGSLLNDISSTFGLTEFGIESETITNPDTASTQQASTFVIGKYLMPKLYLSYGVGLTVPINIVRLQYYLTHRWSIQSETSTMGNGADIFYTFQTN